MEEEDPVLQGYYCSVCSSGLDENMIVICDNCDRGFHTNCRSPPIDLEKNEGDWFCTECQESEGKLTIETIMNDDEAEKIHHLSTQNAQETT